VSGYYAGPNPPSAAELRVLGALIEKKRTTPDQYPLSVNSLRLACNQSTNRDPVVDYDEHAVLDALEHLGRRGWTRLASGPGSRARKYRHTFDDALDLDEGELALLCVLMLRGPQTPGELKQRTERMQGFPDLASVQDTLDRLIERDLVLRLARRPGQKEERYMHRLSEEAAGAPPVETAAAPEPIVAAAPRPSAREDRLGKLEEEMAELRGQVEALRAEIGVLREELGA
jgi:uncharacterized protein